MLRDVLLDVEKGIPVTQNVLDGVSLPPNATEEADVRVGKRSETSGRSLAQWFNAVGITLIHGGTVYAVYRGGDVKLVAMAVAFYFVRMFAITGGYHRYFAHRALQDEPRRSSSCSRCSAPRHAEGAALVGRPPPRSTTSTPTRPRTCTRPTQRGFWWSHVGWIARPRARGDRPRAASRTSRSTPSCAGSTATHWVAVGARMRRRCLLLGGCAASSGASSSRTVLLWHGTFTHQLARPRVRHAPLRDDRRPAATTCWLALITLGEGWHNNHHHYHAQRHQGFFWWEIDVSYYVLKGLGSSRASCGT